MRYMYHATNYDSVYEIIENGLSVEKSIDKLIYLADTEINALKFVVVRGYPKIAVMRIKIPKKLESTIIETFDHNEKFFGCRAYASTKSIDTDRIDSYMIYDNPMFNRGE